MILDLMPAKYHTEAQLIALQNSNFVTSQLCGVMSVKLKINLKHTFFVHTVFAVVGRLFLFMINA